MGNFEGAWRDRNKCENFFWKAHLVEELLRLDFWNSRPFVTIFRNKSTFWNAIPPKAIELTNTFFQIFFLSGHPPSICYAVTWNSILLSILWPHFPAKNRWHRETKTYDCLEYKILPSWKHWAQTDKKMQK